MTWDQEPLFKNLFSRSTLNFWKYFSYTKLSETSPKKSPFRSQIHARCLKNFQKTPLKIHTLRTKTPTTRRGVDVIFSKYDTYCLIEETNILRYVTHIGVAPFAQSWRAKRFFFVFACYSEWSWRKGPTFFAKSFFSQENTKITKLPGLPKYSNSRDLSAAPALTGTKRNFTIYA